MTHMTHMDSVFTIVDEASPTCEILSATCEEGIAK